MNHKIRRILAAMSLVVLLGACGTASQQPKRPIPSEPEMKKEEQSPSDIQEETDSASDQETSAEPKNEDQPDKKDHGGDVLYNGEYYRYNKNIRTYLFMGIDQSVQDAPADAISGGQADTIILLAVDPDKEAVTAIPINRNTMMDVRAMDEQGNDLGLYQMQVCLQHGYGDGKEKSCEMTVDAISDYLYHLPIHGYVSLDLDAIKTINDMVGGVDLESLENFKAKLGHGEVKKGEKLHLLGDDAVWYIQYRDTDTFDSVSLRQERQKQYIKALVAKVQQYLSDQPMKAISMINAISGNMVSDMNIMTIYSKVQAASSYKAVEEKIDGETVMGESGFEEFYPDKDALYDLMIRTFYSKQD